MIKPAVDELMADAFSPDRDRHSQEYIEGVHRALPYELGTAQANPYFAGEGRAALVMGV
ncbi:hypothetical protein [Burkholderia sp. PAMC 28687]|uniref:hypothetical protein n=1 Tax=Burkholderia sp. PAMC 28687 TaxID=1795874 RepID=UPI0012D718CF|nr:hypothetical protein [Burkholderia sp. PAMC 28687]